MKGLARRWRAVAGTNRERGVISLELVIVFPAVLLLIFAGFQTSTYFYGRSLALAAAQEGVQQARILPADLSRGVAAAETFLDQSADGTLVSTEVIPSSTAEQVTITVRAQVVDLLGGIVELVVTQTASGPIERPSR